MFSNIGWGEMAILVIAALVILGPERLPGAMQWLAKTVKQVREYATGAQNQLKDELGPEFEDFKKPLEDLRGLRGMTPRTAITKHLLDGDDSIFTGNFDTPKPTTPPSAGPQSGAPAQPAAPGGPSLTKPAAAPGAPSSADPTNSGQPTAGQPPAGPAPTTARYDAEAT